ncbi:ADP-heptose--LPS heptosyltransferase II [Litchfieldella qijiaojingensis]|uniref:ADP-heptose--LPS heptosyltransferase II n=1 Tax=Litchfieldella qijiaojingensis TaxID=980347 RepID=A0ABQ2YGT3_9GAMM|nr:glycosyltransferase family 9 protein [Halomonas qijiaojingensis]GGX83864.1 ADP-heptose--LPS heptosyltransferase II [Halomonas qijiaojingensis]
MTQSKIRPRARRILVVRNDKLGDFMLAWPALACLKQAQPDNHIGVLVPSYTAPLAHACPWVDEVILDPGPQADRTAQRQLLARMREGGFDALLTLFSTPRIGWLGWRAGIARRMAPATKWAQVFYNHRIMQRRSRSRKPEYQYNLELAEALLEQLGQTRPESLAPPYWPLPATARDIQRNRLAEELALDNSRPWVFLHAGNGGSAANLAPAQYAALAATIDRQASSDRRPFWLLTAGPGEEAVTQRLRTTLHEQGVDAALVPRCQNLEDFALSLIAADLFIAGSTGPLHIAGCLNIPTAGFYPAKRSSTPLRWQTCNAAERRLAFCPPSGADSETDMSRIDLSAAAYAIHELLAQQG